MFNNRSRYFFVTQRPDSGLGLGGLGLSRAFVPQKKIPTSVIKHSYSYSSSILLDFILTSLLRFVDHTQSHTR